MAKCNRCGKGGLFVKLNAEGLCMDCVCADLRQQLHQSENKCTDLEQQLSHLRATIPPEVNDIARLQEELKQLEESTAAKRTESEQLQTKVAELNAQIIEADSTLELESFSLYKAKYNFSSVQEYKDRLDAVRDKQKYMVLHRTAATCSEEWLVNGSRSQGLKHTVDNIKLFLRSFNNECDIAIASVKFNNFDRCLLRIQKSYDTINKLGRISRITISQEYYDLKVEELHLAFEYAQKRQEEKEEQAEIRRQQREQAKLEKEIAEARKVAEKELHHYEQALAKIDAQIFSCLDADKKAELEAKRKELAEGVSSLTAKLEDIDYRLTNQRAGYVYIISNIGAFGENVYKIGVTRRLDPYERVDELGDASVPFDFDVHAMIFSADAYALEAALHQAFDSKRLNKVNRRREYFRVTLDEIKAVVRANHDSTVEFKDECTAEQYRISLKMP